MEDRTEKAIALAALVRTCERSRLEGQFMSDAYERLIPIIRCRCDDRSRGALGGDALMAEQREGTNGGVCSVGGAP